MLHLPRYRYYIYRVTDIAATRLQMLQIPGYRCYRYQVTDFSYQYYKILYHNRHESVLTTNMAVIIPEQVLFLENYIFVCVTTDVFVPSGI